MTLKYGSVLVFVAIGAATIFGFQNCSSGKSSPVARQDSVSSAASFKALCQILRATNDTVVCLDLSSDSVADAHCDENGEVANYQSKGASTMFYHQGSDVDCTRQMAGFHYDLIGSCGTADRVVRYYSNNWTAGQAQADCSARGGGWSI